MAEFSGNTGRMPDRAKTHTTGQFASTLVLNFYTKDEFKKPNHTIQEQPLPPPQILISNFSTSFHQISPNPLPQPVSSIDDFSKLAALKKYSYSHSLLAH
jgi:hypothetical protein